MRTKLEHLHDFRQWIDSGRGAGQGVGMTEVSRRRFAAALAASLAVLGIGRRAVALPVMPRVEPVLPMPPPSAEPVPALPEVYDAGGWLEPWGWIYSPTLGWLHLFQQARDVRQALLYGPPPPISFDLGGGDEGVSKALIAGPLPLRGIHR